MRVLHVTDTYLPRRGGIELHVHDLAQAQRAAGDEVDVLTVTRAAGTTAVPPDGLVLRPADDAGLPTKARFIRDHRMLGVEGGYDVVHAHCSTVSPLSFATIAAARIPTVITVHSLWRRYTPIYRAADLAAGWSRWPVLWSAVSEVAAESVRRSASRDLAVAVVPNGIDVDAWPRSPRQPSAGRLRVVSVMRLAPRKRPLHLLRILRDAARAVPAGTDFSAVIIGDGPQAPAMRRYLRRHRLEHLVTLTGHLPRPEIAHWLSSSDVFVAPATLESFGIAALEACAAGVPVLGRRGTGLADFVGGDKGGMLVESDADMARALVAIAAGRSIVPVDAATVRQLSWPAVVERTREAYVAAGSVEQRRPTPVGRRAS